MSHTHLTAPTHLVEVNGDQFAYRRWGNTATVQPPLFFLQHFRGGMDHWDPLMTDGLAAGREVFVVDEAVNGIEGLERAMAVPPDLATGQAGRGGAALAGA